MSGNEKLRKRLLVNLDGTGQAEYTKSASSKNGFPEPMAVSNVARIGRAALVDDLENNFQQVIYYQAGIGASAELNYTQSAKEALFGQGLVTNIREAYGFICNNYDYGDEIYITGFSRGAFTARSVAGLIGKVGILTKKGLDDFYNAFDYYEFPKKWEEAGKACPVSEQNGTTRIYYPADENGSGASQKRIKIKAVGVWDTVGAMSGDYSFHDVSLGEHIEHGFHALSLDEKRGYYAPTLWESPKGPRPLDKFEQCWIAGDHSNVGGSWDDQQLADIALAWMMSRFDTLGVRFDPAYLYGETSKFKKLLRDQEMGNAKKGEPQYDRTWNPRQWGEGRSKEVPAKLWYGGEVVRKPAMYGRPQFTKGWFTGGYLLETSTILENTNETIHPVIRYRHFSKKPLSVDDKERYSPPALKDWTWPSEQTDGRVGGSSNSGGPKNLAYSKSVKDKNVTVQESSMGKYEKLLLAIYDRERDPKRPNESVWTKVLGGNGPPKVLKEIVSEIVRLEAKPSSAESQALLHTEWNRLQV